MEYHLAENSWLIAITRADLHPTVMEGWNSMSPPARGNYLAGFTELTMLDGGEDEERIAFIAEQLRNEGSLEFTADTACQMGCALLRLGLIEAFEEFMRFNLNWEQEVERDSPTNFRRWKAIDHLSKRVIDVFLEASLIVKQPQNIKIGEFNFEVQESG